MISVKNLAGDHRKSDYKLLIYNWLFNSAIFFFKSLCSFHVHLCIVCFMFIHVMLSHCSLDRSQIILLPVNFDSFSELST